MREHARQPQLQAPAARPLTPDPRPCLRTPEVHPLIGLDHLGHIMPQKPRPVVPTLRDAEVAVNTLDVDVDQKLRIEWAGGTSIPDVPLPGLPLPDVPLPNVPLPNVPLPEAHPDGSFGEE
jgi:hypothetical protein